MECTLCGKELKEGDKAYATTTGVIVTDAYDSNGVPQGEEQEPYFFMDDNEPWLTVACEECGDHVSRLINAFGDMAESEILQEELDRILHEQFEQLMFEECENEKEV